MEKEHKIIELWGSKYNSDMISEINHKNDFNFDITIENKLILHVSKINYNMYEITCPEISKSRECLHEKYLFWFIHDKQLDRFEIIKKYNEKCGSIFSPSSSRKLKTYSFNNHENKNQKFSIIYCEFSHNTCLLIDYQSEKVKQIYISQYLNIHNNCSFFRASDVLIEVGGVEYYYDNLNNITYNNYIKFFGDNGKTFNVVDINGKKKLVIEGKNYYCKMLDITQIEIDFLKFNCTNHNV